MKEFQSVSHTNIYPIMEFIEDIKVLKDISFDLTDFDFSVNINSSPNRDSIELTIQKYSHSRFYYNELRDTLLSMCGYMSGRVYCTNIYVNGKYYSNLIPCELFKDILCLKYSNLDLVDYPINKLVINFVYYISDRGKDWILLPRKTF